jgi:hypothetical protein
VPSGAYRLTQALPTIQVPATVQAVLAARIDRLPPEEKRPLQTAAVIGTEVPLPLLQAIADLPEAAQAETHYQQALALAEALGMRPLVAHCHHGLGRLYHQIGQREEARVALTTAIELYRAMDMTFWLPQAETVLAQVA